MRRPFGQPIVQPIDVNTGFISPSAIRHSFVTHKSGPIVAGDPTDMATSGATPGNPSIFEFTGPPNTVLQINSLIFCIIDTNPTLGEFGGVSSLVNGCLLDIVNAAGVSVLDLTFGRPFKANKDFVFVGGGDVEIISGPGLDRVTVSTIGTRNPLLNAGHSIRWTIRDDLSMVSEFRCLCLATIKV